MTNLSGTNLNNGFAAGAKREGMDSPSSYPAYEAYKDSGVEWLGAIPCEWRTKRLKYLSKVQTGDKDTVNSVDEGEYPFFVRSQTIERIGSYTSDCEAVLTAGDGVGVGKVFHYYNGKFDFHQRVYMLNNFKGCLGKYVYYYLKSNFYKVALEGSAKSTVDSLRLPLFLNFEFALPLVSEQEGIVRFLDKETAKIDTLIEKQEKLIKLLQEKRQAVISHAVTKGLNPDVKMKDSGVEWLGEVPESWDVLAIKRLSQVKRGASPRPIDDPIYFDEDGEYAWTRIADVSKAGIYLISTTQRLSELGSSLSVKLEPNQLFVSIAGTVGKPCITISRSCIHDGFVYFPGLTINNKFLYFIFAAGEAYRGLGKMGTQLNLNTDTVGAIKIGLPPAHEIEAIVESVEKSNQKYDYLISKAKDSIELMKERRTALISAAVTGKIDVRQAA